MNIVKTKEFCRSFPCVTEKENGHPSNILTYKIEGKKFAYFKTSNPEQWRFSIRCTPERFLELTDQPGIKPARYMHRFHWVSIINVNEMDEQYLKELINWSFDKALNSLPKKIQKQVLLNIPPANVF